MDSQHEYLFGLMSLVEGYIDAAQLRQAMETWKTQSDRPIAEILTERGWLSEDARSTVEELVKAELDRGSRIGSPEVPPSTAIQSEIDQSMEATVTRPPSVDAGSETLSRLAEIWTSRERNEGGLDFGSRYIVDPKSRQCGGMKEVYWAIDSKLGRVVAIARLKPELADQREIVSRFVTEARITSKLDHPNIVPVHDLERFADPPFYSMPYLTGQTLKRAIESHHKLPTGDPAQARSFRQLLENFVGVCHAIGFAHSKGVIHRDIKGANVQIDEYGTSIVLDWGLAKRLDVKEDPLGRETDPNESEEDETRTYNPTRNGGVLGTVNYIPPEQAKGELDRVGKLSDVFGLGAMLYTILAGCPPYRGKGEDPLKKAMIAEFDRPRLLDPGVPKPLERICLKAMALEPRSRYESVEALAEDVRRWLGDEPVSVFSEPVSARAGRWMRKHQSIVAGAAMLLITAVIGLSIGIWRVSVANERTIIAAETAWQAIEQTLDFHESRLSNVPGLQDVRRTLATSGLSLAHALRDLHPDEPETMRRTSISLNRLANVHRMFHQSQQAMDAYNAAINNLDELVRRKPEFPLFRYRLAWCLVDRADERERSGHLDEAQRDLDRVFEHLKSLKTIPDESEALPRDHPMAPLLTRANNESAVVATRQGRFAEAVAFAEAAIQAGQSENSQDEAQARRLVLTRVNLAMAWRQLGNPQKADESSLAALLVADALYNKTNRGGTKPDNDRSFLLAHASIERGWTLLNAASVDAEKAACCFHEAVEILSQLVVMFPEIPLYRSRLNNARSGRGVARASLSKKAGTSHQAMWLRELAGIDLRLASTEGKNVVTTTAEYQAESGLVLARLARWHLEAGDKAEARSRFLEAMNTLGIAQSRSPKDKIIARDLVDLRREFSEIWPGG